MPGPAFKPARYVVVEGPIRVGKSSLARILAEQMHARRVLDCEANPFLTDFYAEKPGAAFRAQMFFLMERHRRLREVDFAANPAPVVSDFLLEKDKVFAYINLDNEELKVYEQYFELLAQQLPRPDLVIYLQAPPEVLLKRVEKKAQPEEQQITLEYLAAIARAYDHFFFRYSASDLLVVNTSEIDFVARNQDLQNLLRRLQQPVKGTQYYLPLGRP